MRRLAAALLTLCLLGVAAAGERGQELVVSLRGTTGVDGRFVRLDQVADLSGRNAAAAGRVLLGQTPKTGARTVIEGSEVAHRLEEEGFDRRLFRIVGAGQVVVRRATRSIAKPAAKATRIAKKTPTKKTGASRKVTPGDKLSARFIEWVRQSLAKRLGCKPDRLVVTMSGRVSGTLPTEGIAGLTPEILWPVGRMRLGRQNVTAIFKRGRERTGRLQGYVNTAARMNVLVLTRDLRREDIVASGDVRKTELLLTKLGSSYLTDSKGLIGAAAARSLRAGDPLEPRMFKKQKLVKRGNPVTIVAESGAVRVTERGIAKTDGGLGDVIVVQRSHGRRQITAKVAGSGIVKVD